MGLAPFQMTPEGKKRKPAGVTLQTRKPMNLTLEIPDELARPMCAAGSDLSRPALEALALEEYKPARISRAQLRSG